MAQSKKEITNPIIIGAILSIVITLFIYFMIFNGGLSENQNEWSSFGSYVGGVLGPLLSFFSIVLVVLTLKKQDEVLKNQEESISNQNREALIKHQQESFFKLLEVLSRTNSEIFVVRKQQTYRGEMAFRLIFGDWRNRIDGLHSSKKLTMKILEDEFPKFYKTYRYNLGHYYRLTYNIIKYIDNSVLDDKEKRQYLTFLTATFSQTQLQLIFYNCLVGKGKQKYKKFVERYHLFENVEFDPTGPSILFKNEFDESAFKDT